MHLFLQIYGFYMTVYCHHCAFNMSKSDLYYADLMVLVIIASFFS